jgi:hypothetical protein
VLDLRPVGYPGASELLFEKFVAGRGDAADRVLRLARLARRVRPCGGQVLNRAAWVCLRAGGTIMEVWLAGYVYCFM